MCSHAILFSVQICSRGASAPGRSLVPTVRSISSGLRSPRHASADPRPSIAVRYASRDDYLARVRQAAEQLVQARYLLAEDIDVCLAQASKFWDYFATGAAHG
jgi:hypothetical protein